MRIVHLIFYSFYRTASWINRYIPLKGGGIGGAASFLSIIIIIPIASIYKYQSYFKFNIEYIVLLPLVILGYKTMTYFDKNGKKIILSIEKENIQMWRRMLFVNGLLCLFIILTIYLFK